MSSSYKETLDQLERSERFGFASSIFWIVLFALPLVGLMAIYIPTGSTEVMGTVVTLHADSSTGHGIWHVAIVRLDAGPTVQARLVATVRPTPWQRVAVTETRTLLF